MTNRSDRRSGGETAFSGCDVWSPSFAQPIGQRFTAIGAKISLCWQVAAGEFRPADILKRHANPIIRLPLPRYRLTNEFTPIAFPSFDLLDGHDQPSALSPLRNTENWSTSSDSL